MTTLSVCFQSDFVITAAFFNTDSTVSQTTSASGNVPHTRICRKLSVRFSRYTKKRWQKVVQQRTRDSIDSDVNPKTGKRKRMLNLFYMFYVNIRLNTVSSLRLTPSRPPMERIFLKKMGIPPDSSARNSILDHVKHVLSYTIQFLLRYTF